MAGGGGPLLSTGGQPFLARGSLSRSSKPPVMGGRGLKPYYPSRNVVKYFYNPPVLRTVGRFITAMRVT